MRRPALPLRRPIIVAVAVALAAAASIPASAALGHQEDDTVNATHHSDAAHHRPDPFRYLPKLPSFRLTSTSITDGQPLPKPQRSTSSKLPEAKNISPELSWSHTPAGAKSYVVTMYDPESPILGGAIQWVVVNIPGSQHSLPTNAGAPHSPLLPKQATEVPTSAGPGGYIGGNPEPGTGAHHYYFTVWALDVPSFSLTGNTKVALTNYALFQHAIARASIICPTSASD